MKAVFISVRTNSKRLPQKALRKICGKPTIEYVIDRAKQSKRADRVVLCTTELPEDNELVKIASKKDILWFRGSEEDKLDRWLWAASYFDVDFFVTADGDDLLCEPLLIDLAFEQYRRNDSDFIKCDGVSCGAFTYGISVRALKKVCEIKGSADTEMMIPYFTETGLFHVEELENVPKKLRRPEIRMTLDYMDDLRFFKAIFGHFKYTKKYGLEDVLAYLDEHPEVVKINQHCQEMYLNNQKKKTRLVLN